VFKFRNLFHDDYPKRMFVGCKLWGSQGGDYFRTLVDKAA